MNPHPAVDAAAPAADASLGVHYYAVMRPLRDGRADDNRARPNPQDVAAIHAWAAGTLSCSGRPVDPMPSPSRDAGRWTPIPRGPRRRATCQLIITCDVRPPRDVRPVRCVRLAGDVTVHDDSEETMRAQLALALERIKPEFKPVTFSCLVWCAMRGLSVCRHGLAVDRTPLLAG